MRVVNNYGTSLLDYLNNDKSVKDVINEGVDGSTLSPSARKVLKEHGLKIGSGSTSSNDSTYTSIKDSAENIRQNVLLLSDKKDNSIFSTAEQTGKKDKVVSTIKSFVDSYNDMVNGMDKMGWDSIKKYLTELSGILTENKEELEIAGITIDKSGKMVIDEDTLNKADLSGLKKLFQGSDSFAEKIAGKSIYVEANALSAQYASTVSNYTNNGTYMDSTLSSFLKSIIIYNNINEIITLSNNELKENNFIYTSSAKLGKINYEEKNNIYESMEEGSYDSLQILLGKAEGKNYWNLIFPNKENIQNLEGLENILPGITDIYEETNSNSNEEKVYSFKIFEIFGIFLK